MVFFGEARWEDHAEEHGAHGDFKPHESPPVDAAPARRARRPVDRRWASSSCRRHVAARLDHHSSSTGSSRSSSSARPTSPARGPTTTSTLLMRASPPSVARRRHRRSPASCTSGSRIKAVEPEVLADGWYYDQTVSDFMGGPGREAFEAVAWFDAQRHRRRGQRRRHARSRGAGRRLRKAQSGYVRNYAGDHRRRRRAAAAWFVVVRGISDAESSAFPILTTLIARAGRRRARSSPSLPQPAARARAS